MFTIEEILTIVTGILFVDGCFDVHPILAHLYGGEQCSAHRTVYTTDRERVKAHLCQQIPGLTELLRLGTAPATREALPGFKDQHGEDFYITPL